MKFLTLITLLFILATVTAQMFTNCATGLTDMIIEGMGNFSLSPSPLCVGRNACATAVGTLLTPIIRPSTFSITGKYLGRIVYTDNQNLCSLLHDQGFFCPIPTSVTTITVCALIKPSAPYNV